MPPLAAGLATGTLLAVVLVRLLMRVSDGGPARQPRWSVGAVVSFGDEVLVELVADNRSLWVHGVADAACVAALARWRDLATVVETRETEASTWIVSHPVPRHVARINVLTV